jgi:hypothetical protein
MYKSTLSHINGDDEVVTLSPCSRSPKAENFRSKTKADLEKLLDAKELAVLHRLLQNSVSLDVGSLVQIRDIFSLSDQQLQKMNQMRILKCLKFRVIDEKHKFAKAAAKHTFGRTLLDPVQKVSTRKKPQISLKEWLSSGSGIFHISGRPDSGRSIFMEYIYRHPQTTRELRSWAGKKKLSFTRFSFLDEEDTPRKTLIGLVQFLLFSVLSQFPDEIVLVFPKHWNLSEHMLRSPQPDLDIGDDEILTAFDKLIENVENYKDHRFCFFIDGLDKFEDTQGRRADVVERLCKCANGSSGAVKICFSSRELDTFQNRLPPTQKIRLQDLTRGDIERIVGQTLTRDDHFQELKRNDRKACQQLVKGIVNRSGGVFLWVTLVLKWLLARLENRDSLSKLQQKLNSIPIELEELVDYILESIDEADRKEAYCAFAIFIKINKFQRHKGLPLLRCSFLADILKDSEFAIKVPVWDISDNEADDRLAHASIRLSRCCKGLLEVRNSLDRFESPHDVQLRKVFKDSLKFTHRKVPELLEKCIQKEGAKYLNDVDIVNVFSQSLIAQIKSVPFSAEEEPTGEASYDLAYELAYEVRGVVDPAFDSELENGETYFSLFEALDEALRLRQQATCPDFQDLKWSKYYALLPWNLERFRGKRVAYISMLHIAAYADLDRYVWWKIDHNQGLMENDADGRELFKSICHGIDKWGSSKIGTAPGLYTLETLFRRGFSVNSASMGSWDDRLSLWQEEICNLLFSCQPDNEWDIIEVFLKFGADPRCWFELSDTTEEQEDTGVIKTRFEKMGPEYIFDFEYFPIKDFVHASDDGRASFRDFVDFCQPHNCDAILALMDPNIAKLELEESEA